MRYVDIEKAREIARLITELQVVTMDGVRCIIMLHEGYGALACGPNKSKRSLAKHWSKVESQIKRRVKRLYELLFEEEKKDCWLFC